MSIRSDLENLEALFEKLELQGWNTQTPLLEEEVLEEFAQLEIGEDVENVEHIDVADVELPPELDAKFNAMLVKDCCHKNCLHKIKSNSHIRQVFLDLNSMKSKEKLHLLSYTLSLGAIPNPGKCSYIPFLSFFVRFDLHFMKL